VAKKAVIGLFAKMVKNPKTKKIATIIPIKGNIKDPKTSGWATFVGILKTLSFRHFMKVLVTKSSSSNHQKRIEITRQGYYLALSFPIWPRL
jgi:hypothetical protein